MEIMFGVPQGSALGPSLFLFYSSDLPKVLKKDEIMLFADDTTIYTNQLQDGKIVTNKIKVENRLKYNSFTKNAKIGCLLQWEDSLQVIA